MPDILLIITGACGLAVLIANIAVIWGENKFKRWHLITWIFCGILLAADFLWVSTAFNTHNIVTEDLYELEVLKYKDGTEEQIISLGPMKKESISKNLGKILPEGTKIKRIEYSNYAWGIYKINPRKTRYEVVLCQDGLQ